MDTNKSPNIHFIITGGTIDSYYDGTQDTVIPHKKSCIPRYIQNLKPNFKAKFTQVCMKDSRQLTQKDRKNILKTINKSPWKKIIITHGTYTMPDTARFLKNNLKKIDKKIILIGSLIPLTDFPFSDAPFNLGFAIGQLEHIKNGVYVCMNGKVFKPEEVIKLIKEGKFISIFGEK